VIYIEDLALVKREGLERLAAYLGIRTEQTDDQQDLALRVMRALRKIEGEE
jgi:hypothetical protein